jgi:hypothetical protein
MPIHLIRVMLYAEPLHLPTILEGTTPIRHTNLPNPYRQEPPVRPAIIMRNPQQPAGLPAIIINPIPELVTRTSRQALP